MGKEYTGKVVQIKDSEIRKNSASGGAFYAIAMYTLENKGYVVGAAYVNNKVEHIIINDITELSRLSGSKYVQSKLGNTFTNIKHLLNNNELVCFSGTPCQVNGLINFLGKQYDNLITVCVACKGVGSPYIFDKYVNLQEKQHKSSIKKINFKEKRYGYSSTSMFIEFDNGDIYRRGHESDPYLYLYVNEAISRKSCYNCNAKIDNNMSDFIIFDCWSIGKISSELDDDKGTTSVLFLTQKAKRLWGYMTKNCVYEGYDADSLINFDGRAIKKSPKENKYRDNLFKDSKYLDDTSFFKKYANLNVKRWLKMVSKPVFYKLGVLRIVKGLKEKKYEKKK